MNVLKASYGNDSVALMYWCAENSISDITILYNDTGWYAPEWSKRVAHFENIAKQLGFATARTESEGMENLVRRKKGWPRQGIQFCTQYLKIEPSERWLNENDPSKASVQYIGVRRCESANRADFPYEHIGLDGRKIIAPLIDYSDEMRDNILHRHGIDVLPHRSKECSPCVNSNRRDILGLSEERIVEIEYLESDLGLTSKGKPRTMFRPYRYMGATGIREIVRWANSAHGKFDLDDGGGVGCEAGWCGK